MKTKKFTTIFLSVILILVTLLTVEPVKVLAYSNEYNLNSVYENNINKTKIKPIIEDLQRYDDDYYVLFTYDTQVYQYRMYLVPKNDYTINEFTFYYSSKTTQINMKIKSKSADVGYYYTNSYYFSSVEDTFIQLEQDEILNNYYSTASESGTTGNLLTSAQGGKAILLYSNVDCKVNYYGSSNMAIYNGANLTIGKILPSYYDWLQDQTPNINISSSSICDLNDKDAQFVTIDYSEGLNDIYTYQYGIKRVNGSIVWKNVTLDNGRYQFTEYYNGTIIYAQILDANGEVISQNNYTINDSLLPKFEITMSSGLACPIPNYDGDTQAEIINIDFRNVYFENYKYYYSYDSKTKYQINVTSEQLTHQIVEYLYNFIYFYIYDENDNLIYYTYNDVSSSNRLGNLPDDYEIRHNIEFSNGVACDLEGNKIINVRFDFSNITKFINHYNFDVVINGKHFGAIQYHEITLNEQNYTQNYEVKIYIDTFLYLNRTYSVGGALGGQDFEDTYDNMLNNGNWKDDLEVKDVEDMGDLVIQFLGAISTFISTFFDLLDFFFQRLNFWIRACIITLFIELVICKIIKGVRK